MIILPTCSSLGLIFFLSHSLTHVLRQFGNGCVFSAGRAGDMVPGSHDLDRELSGSGSFCWSNRAPPIWCLEWWQEIGGATWRGLWSCEEANKYHTIRSHSWWPAKVAERLLQGIYSVAISLYHCIDLRRILCAPPYAGSQFSAPLVGIRYIRFILDNEHEKLETVYKLCMREKLGSSRC